MTKKIIKSFIAVLLLFVSHLGLTQRLSNASKISLITIYPGEELYSTFGHSAFWVYDTKSGIDRVYNYGTFNFEQPGFYTKFIRGKLLYELSVSDMQSLVWFYQQENRGIVEQVLNLTLQEKERLFGFLERNYLPENRAYKYDFFFDNCSSRLRDALKSACGNDLQFHQVEKEKKSYRQLLDPFLMDKQWQDLGMDTGLGTPSDKIAPPYNYMFLPIHLMNAFDSATINHNQKAEKLVKATNVLYKQTPKEDAKELITPALCFWLFFFLILIVCWIQWKNKTAILYLDLVLWVFTGLLGFLIVFLWFGTDHKVTANNWNLIWAMPLNLIVILLAKKNKLKGSRYYFLIYGIALILLLLSWNLIPQEINLATFPFILTMAVRSFFIYYKLKTIKAV
jgi:hypothetical protein